MQRILEPGQIETLAQRVIPRLRLPDRATVFATRASRLRKQSESGALGHAIGDYLRLMASLADAQQAALARIESTPPTADQVAETRTFRMPLVPATGWQREEHWRRTLISMLDSLAAQSDTPAKVRTVFDELRARTPEQLEARADALLAMQTAAIDVASAPFVMAALQVYWVALVSTMRVDDIPDLDVAGTCPSCGTLPVASIVRVDPRSQGLRYLHCALCATEWHMVRVRCSHCLTTQGISYQSIEDGSAGIRAECCDTCRTYRKILYQEQDAEVEAVADDLASIALDLLLGQAGYHRVSPNPLLWSG